MAGVLQTFTATTAVVQISIDVVKLIRKIACAQGEANKWLSELERLKDLWTLIDDIISERTSEGSNVPISPHEQKIINTIRSYMEACKEYIASVLIKLKPLAQHPDYFRISQVPARIKFLYDKEFIEEQVKLLDRHCMKLSACLSLLPMVYTTASTTRPQSQVPDPQCLQRMLSIDAPSLNSPVSLDSPAGQGSRSTDRWSGPTAFSAMFPLECSETTSSSNDAATTSSIHGTGTLELVSCMIEDGILMEAVEMSNVEEVQRLLNLSTDSDPQSIIVRNVQTPNSDGWTVLHHAAHQCNPVITRTILEYCERRTISIIDNTNSNNHTALMEAAKKAGTPGSAKVARELLAYGADMDKVDKTKRCALHFAMCSPPNTARERFVDVLLTCTPKPNVELVIQTLGEKYVERKYPKVWKMYQANGHRRTDSLDSGIGVEISRAYR